MKKRRSLAVLTVFAVVFLTAWPVHSSSHREAPFITEHPKVDGTDFYMFRSYEPGREGFVTLIANYVPLQDAYGGPNFFTMDPDARYRINIENDGDSVEDIIFEFDFLNIYNQGSLNIGGVEVQHPLRTLTPLALPIQPNEAELYTVRVIRGDDPAEFATNGRIGGIFFAKALDYFGQKTFADYESYAQGRILPIQIPGCDDGRVFVGQRKESFAVNLGEFFDLVNLNPVGDPTPARSSTEDKNITSLALEVPIDCLTEGEGDVIGGWTTALLPRTRELLDEPTFDKPEALSKDFVQVSRLGMPLVNEVVIGLGDKNKFNASHPQNDLANFAVYVTNPTIPAILFALFGVEPPVTPRNDLVATFVTGIPGLNDLGVGEMQRLNTAIPATPKDQQANLGVVAGDNAGFPNGRRPGDDTVDIVVRVAMGLLCHLNLGLCDPGDAPSGLLPFTDQTYQGPDQFDDVFPYLRPPVPGAPNPVRVFTANLTGRQQVPPVETNFSGGCGAVLTPDGNDLAISCTHNAPVLVAHIHQGAPGENGPIICDFGNGQSPIQFLCPMTPALRTALEQGNLYVNVHTQANLGGEIRGQLR